MERKNAMCLQNDWFWIGLKIFCFSQAKVFSVVQGPSMAFLSISEGFGLPNLCAGFRSIKQGRLARVFSPIALSKELMIKMMNAPLASLLASSCPKRCKDDEGKTHPWLSLQQSLASLGASSFLNGAPSKATPAEFSIPQVINQCTNRKSNMSSQCTNQKSFSGNFMNMGNNICPSCGDYLHQCCCTPTGNRAQQGLVLKDNCKFMVTDNLQIFESSTIKAMELMKEHVDDFRGIQTATVTVNEDYVRKFILCSLLGSKNVFTELFPDGGESDGSFEAIDPPKKNGKLTRKGKWTEYTTH